MLLALVAAAAYAGATSQPPAPPGPPSRSAAPAPDAPFVTTADYPRASLRAREHGVVRMQVTVAPTGRVTRCTIVASSGFPRLDAASCQLTLDRALYRPARDSSGRPVESETFMSIYWNLPAR